LVAHNLIFVAAAPFHPASTKLRPGLVPHRVGELRVNPVPPVDSVKYAYLEAVLAASRQEVDRKVLPAEAGMTEDEIEKILKACDKYEGPNRSKLIILTELILETGLRIGDAVTITKNRIVKRSAGWVVELRTAKTGTAVSCPVPSELVLALNGDTPFWSAKAIWKT
jgi:integrase